DEKPPWAIPLAAARGPGWGAPEYETDRVRFLGRGRTPADPAALDAGTRLSGTTGPVLDAVFSLRRRVRLDPKAQASIAFITGAADTRDAANALAEQFRKFDAVDRTFSTAQAGCRDELRKLDLPPEDVALFNRLAGSVVFTSSLLRPTDAVAANRLGQPGLWPHGISGDLPIVLVRVAAPDDESLVRRLVYWHAYVRGRGLNLDLVILDERPGDAGDRLRADLQGGVAGQLLGKPGGVFVLVAEKIPPDDRVLLAAAARAVLGSGRGSLADQIDRRPAAATLAQPPIAGTPIAAEPKGPSAPPPEGLRFWNGHGGFTPDGGEYVIVIDGT